MGEAWEKEDGRVEVYSVREAVALCEREDEVLGVFGVLEEERDGEGAAMIDAHQSRISAETDMRLTEGDSSISSVRERRRS